MPGMELEIEPEPTEEERQAIVAALALEQAETAADREGLLTDEP